MSSNFLPFLHFYSKRGASHWPKLCNITGVSPIFKRIFPLGNYFLKWQCVAPITPIWQTPRFKVENRCFYRSCFCWLIEKALLITGCFLPVLLWACMVAICDMYNNTYGSSIFVSGVCLIRWACTTCMPCVSEVRHKSTTLRTYGNPIMG